jgi:hypothetical protein
MNNDEMPEVVASSYVTTTTSLEPGTGFVAQDAGSGMRRVHLQEFKTGGDVFEGINKVLHHAVDDDFNNEEDEVMSDKRLVRVLVVDPDEQVPVEQSVLHDGKEQLTDLTDQELFFEVEIQAALKKHNEKRAAIINKTVKDRTEYLEPARIRDLKMLVVTLAEF